MVNEYHNYSWQLHPSALILQASLELSYKSVASFSKGPERQEGMTELAGSCCLKSSWTTTAYNRVLRWEKIHKVSAKLQHCMLQGSRSHIKL